MRTALKRGMMLAIELERFKIWLKMPNDAFLAAHDLTDDELKTILRMFLSAESLNDYLRRKGTSLENWLSFYRSNGAPLDQSESPPHWQLSL